MREADWYDVVVGERAAHIRTILSIPVAEAAEMLGITRQTLSNYESGRTPMRAKVLRSLCDLYEVSPSWLLGLDNELYHKSKNDGVTITVHETSRTIPSPLSRPSRLEE